MSYKLTQTGQRVQELLDQIATGAVLYSQKQELESNQQAQARTNIGAVGTDQLPKKVSELENDAHYITENQVPVALPQKTGAIQSGVLPTTGWDILDEGWKESTLSMQRRRYSVTYGNGKFVAVEYNSPNGGYSTDGITWKYSTMPASLAWRSVTYGNGKFVAVSYSATAAYSTDGITWTATTMPENLDWRNLTYGNGKFVVGAYNSEYGAYSTDGINWTTMNMPAGRDWRNIIYGNDKFVAVAADSSIGAYWNVSTQVTYSITDTFLTANTSVKMYLTDNGGVKAKSKASGSITVIRDSVPTTAIPYEYEVEQTSEEGLFEVINTYVPNVSVTSVNGQTGAVTIAVPTLVTETLQGTKRYKTFEDLTDCVLELGQYDAEGKYVYCV